MELQSYENVNFIQSTENKDNLDLTEPRLIFCGNIESFLKQVIFLRHQTTNNQI
jgi:hypothetical protein